MIRTDKEYREAVVRVRQEKRRLAAQEAELKNMGLRPAQLKRAMDPVRSFHEQLADEVRAYERLRRGRFDDVLSLRELGPLLVSLRIARGMTQRQLARRLGVHETLVSRDERNEYHGITLDRAARIVEAIGAQVRSHVELTEPKRAEVA